MLGACAGPDLAETGMAPPGIGQAELATEYGRSDATEPTATPENELGPLDDFRMRIWAADWIVEFPPTSTPPS